MSLTELPKVIRAGLAQYHLSIYYTENVVFVRYVDGYHEGYSAFSYWLPHGNDQALFEKTQEFLKKWVDNGNVIVRE